MSRMIIQVGDNKVAYDGREWTPVSGESSRSLARLMKSYEFVYQRRASAHPDYAYDVALAAANDWRGRIVEYHQDPNAIPPEPGRIY